MPQETLPKQALLVKANGRRPVGRPRMKKEELLLQLYNFLVFRWLNASLLKIKQENAASMIVEQDVCAKLELF